MKQWKMFTAREIKPAGWLKKQLRIQAEGLSGNLDRVWRDVRESQWIGGAAEGWERVPYWLDGFLPLAYLLEDQDMISRAQKYIDAILASQEEDGWICPVAPEGRKNYDSWAVQLISKVLAIYYETTGDEKAYTALYRVLKNYYSLLSEGSIRLFDYGKYRWFECFIAINLVYERCSEEWLPALAQILREQGYDYSASIEEWKKSLNKWTYETHIVNLSMMLKSESVSCDILSENYTDQAERFRNILHSYNGTAVEAFTGDECLGGLNPIHGTELCAVVEMMYSYEVLYAYTGDPKWIDRLEILAFNALPGTLSDDMWTHQYDQMSNQIACYRMPGRPVYTTNSAESNMFGLEPNYGCCTANFGQGWPKFTLSAFMHRDDTIISVIPVPCELKNDTARITVDSCYPFENSVKYRILSKKAFTFMIRIPTFAKNASVNGRPFADKTYSVRVEAGSQKEIVVSFDADPCFEKTACGMTAARCGSLVFSVPIKYRKTMHEYEADRVERKFPYCDYEYFPESDWNYAYCDAPLKRISRQIGDVPFSSENPPVVLKACVQKIDWGLEEGYEYVCAKWPASVKPLSPPEEIDLYPYGSAKLRMTELPLKSV